MDLKEEARLLRLYDEVESETEDKIDECEIDSTSEENPYGGSDDRDLDYLPTNDSSAAESCGDSNLNPTPPPVVNQTVVNTGGSSSDESDDWEDI